MKVEELFSLEHDLRRAARQLVHEEGAPVDQEKLRVARVRLRDAARRFARFVDAVEKRNR